MTNISDSDFNSISLITDITVDFGEVKNAPTECKEKCFKMMSSAYLHYNKAFQYVLMLMIHLRKRSGT